MFPNEELEEATRIDGANRFEVILPVVSIVAIFTAIAIWNDIFFPVIFIFYDSKKTIPLAISRFVSQARTD